MRREDFACGPLPHPGVALRPRPWVHAVTNDAGADTGPLVHDAMIAQLASMGFAPDMAAAALAASGNNFEQAVGFLLGGN